MVRGITVIAVLALLSPITPAVAKAPPPGRTVVLTVTGVPKAAKAAIVLKGPKKTRKTVKTYDNRTVLLDLVARGHQRFLGRLHRDVVESRRVLASHHLRSRSSVRQ
jgi:hypothetical protein